MFVSYPKLSPESSSSSISSGPTSSTPVCLWVTLQHPMTDGESVPLCLVSASSPHTGHHLPRRSSPLCTCVCHTKTKEIQWKKKKKQGLVGSKRGYSVLEGGRGLLLSSSSPFSPAWSVNFHRTSRTKGVSAFDEELKRKVSRTYLQV